MIAEAIADYLLKGQPGAMDSETRRLGEEAVVDKINDIMDSLKATAPMPEASAHHQADQAAAHASPKQDLRRLRDSPVRYEPMRQSQPVVVPVVINQGVREENPLGVSQDNLRDIVGQAVSTQL